MTSYLLVAVAVVSTTVANVLLRLGMERVGKVHGLFATVRAALAEPRVWAGVACLLSFFVCYNVALMRLPVSLANPLTAVNIVLGVAFAAWKLGESVSPRRWFGVALVMLGVVLVSL